MLVETAVDMMEIAVLMLAVVMAVAMALVAMGLVMAASRPQMPLGVSESWMATAQHPSIAAAGPHHHRRH